MNATIDFGNTFGKIGFFRNNTLIRYSGGHLLNDIVALIQAENPESILFSSVSVTFEDFTDALQRKYSVYNLSPELPLPINVNYGTPETLGADRIAAAVGAHALYPNENLLVIDMGTCITYDWIDKYGVFQGGIISPGMFMRFKAMHTFTKRLPLISPGKDPAFVGKTTHEAIESGVMNGILAEIEGIIEHYRHNYDINSVLICGGDTPYFESRLKPAIFAVPELVLIGLNRILTYNVLKN